MKRIKPIILAGGYGTRARHRYNCPKQFAQLGNRSTYQETLSRLTLMQAPFITANQNHKNWIIRQSAEDASVYYEPDCRNTAAAVVIACMHLQETGHSYALITPSDHIITNVLQFQKDILKGLTHLEHHNQDGVLFGIQPKFPSHEYGYIQTDQFGTVVSFEEKPDTAKATDLLNSSPRTYRNAGLFLFCIDTVLNQLRIMNTDIYALYEAAYHNPTFDNYNILPFLSFDQLYLEQCHNLFCLEARFDWQDIGVQTFNHTNKSASA